MDQVAHATTFTGKEQDPSGYYYFGARYYEPQTQMWLSPDPALASFLGSGSVRPGQLSVYSYAGNNPVILVDPSGLDPVCSAGQCPSVERQAGQEDRAAAAKAWGAALYKKMRAEGRAAPPNLQPSAGCIHGVDGDCAIGVPNWEWKMMKRQEAAEDFLSGLANASNDTPVMAGTSVSSGGPGLPPTDEPLFTPAKPAYKPNPAHDPNDRANFDPRKTPEPADSAAVYELAKPDPRTAGVFWGYSTQNNQMYRYAAKNAETAHFTGATGLAPRPLPTRLVPVQIRRGFGFRAK